MLCAASQGWVRQGRRGELGPGAAMRRFARFGDVWTGLVRHGSHGDMLQVPSSHGLAARVAAERVLVWLRKAGLVRSGQARSVSASYAFARSVMARQSWSVLAGRSEALRGTAQQGRRGNALRVGAERVNAGLGESEPGSSRDGYAWRGSHGGSGRCKAVLGTAVLGSSLQGCARQPRQVLAWSARARCARGESRPGRVFFKSKEVSWRRRKGSVRAA